MKILKTFSGLEFPITEDEAKNVEDAINAGARAVKLRSGDFLKEGSIEGIINPPKIWRYKGFPVSAKKDKFLREGEWVSIQQPELLVLETDPTYKNLEEKLLMQ